MDRRRDPVAAIGRAAEGAGPARPDRRPRRLPGCCGIPPTCRKWARRTPNVRATGDLRSPSAALLRKSLPAYRPRNRPRQYLKSALIHGMRGSRRDRIPRRGARRVLNDLRALDKTALPYFERYAALPTSVAPPVGARPERGSRSMHGARRRHSRARAAIARGAITASPPAPNTARQALAGTPFAGLAGDPRRARRQVWLLGLGQGRPDHRRDPALSGKSAATSRAHTWTRRSSMSLASAWSPNDSGLMHVAPPSTARPRRSSVPPARLHAPLSTGRR